MWKKRAIFLLICMAFCTAWFYFMPQLQAIRSNAITPQEKKLNALYHTLHQNPNWSMLARLDYISASFLNAPYALSPLGEGENARYNQSPLFCMHQFDCQTYVETVIALAIASTETVFKHCMNRIRYKNGQVGFITRNHFTSLDWNPNNQKAGFLKDITREIHAANHHSIARIASALINKPAWYQHLTSQQIHLPSNNKRQVTASLNELKQLGQLFSPAEASIPYLDFADLFDAQGQPNLFIFSQIPSGSIIEIVRPSWDLRTQIGTHLNISHLGLVFWKKDTLWFREASSQEKKVIEVPFIAYLKRARLSPTIKGINIQIILPQIPLKDHCNPVL